MRIKKHWENFGYHRIKKKTLRIFCVLPTSFSLAPPCQYLHSLRDIFDFVTPIQSKANICEYCAHRHNNWNAHKYSDSVTCISVKHIRGTGTMWNVFGYTAFGEKETINYTQLNSAGNNIVIITIKSYRHAISTDALHSSSAHKSVCVHLCIVIIVSFSVIHFASVLC